MAGAIAELAYHSLKQDFRNIDTTQTRIFLAEGMDRVLPPYAPDLSAKAQDSLARLGVTIQTGTIVTQVDGQGVTMRQGDQTQEIPTRTVLWAAGVKALVG